MTEAAPPRPVRRPLWRILPLIVGLGGAALLQHFYGTHPVELLVSLPSANDDGSGLDLRITRAKDHKLILEVTELARSPGSHTVVIHTKLPRGSYHVAAWLQSPAHVAFTADFDYAGGEVADVKLVPR